MRLTETESDPAWIRPAMRGDVRWNFTKFIVAPNGDVVARFGSGVDPMSREVTAAVEKVLPKR